MSNGLGSKVFHDIYPVEITGLTESEIKSLIITYRKLNGLAPIEVDDKPKVIVKVANKEVNIKKSKKSGSVRKKR
jgi:hypothetical protein